MSVLPWYASIEQQNARKWWVYNRVYPLFVPADSLLPFQHIRPTRLDFSEDTDLSYDDIDSGYITLTGQWLQPASCPTTVAIYYIPSGVEALYVEHLPKPWNNMAVSIAAFNSNDECIGVYTPDFKGQDYIDVGWVLPENTSYVYVTTANTELPAPEYPCEVYSSTPTIDQAEITMFNIYDKNGNFVTPAPDIMDSIVIVPFATEGYDVIIYQGLPASVNLAEGQYYAEMSDGYDTWYSEVFTAVTDMSRYLKIEWWDLLDFKMDAGTIVYKYGDGLQFKNILYLQADIAKPEYPFEEEGETRDGYFFPIKQISTKRYKFAFFASEYLLDVMRFIRMADFAEITNAGEKYNLDTFLITPDWEDNGDVASVKAEFDTATVAKKIGTAYIKSKQREQNNI